MFALQAAAEGDDFLPLLFKLARAKRKNVVESSANWSGMR